MTMANAKSRRATFASPSREANARRAAASCSVRVIATVIVSLRRQSRAIESYHLGPDQERLRVNSCVRWYNTTPWDTIYDQDFTEIAAAQERLVAA